MPLPILAPAFAPRSQSECSVTGHAPLRLAEAILRHGTADGTVKIPVVRYQNIQIVSSAIDDRVGVIGRT
jgi:hypothetical protein